MPPTSGPRSASARSFQNLGLMQRRDGGDERAGRAAPVAPATASRDVLAPAVAARAGRAGAARSGPRRARPSSASRPTPTGSCATSPSPRPASSRSPPSSPRRRGSCSSTSRPPVSTSPRCGRLPSRSSPPSAPTGTTVVVVAHDVEFVMRVCDHVYVLAEGSVLFDGPPARGAVEPRRRRGLPRDGRHDDVLTRRRTSRGGYTKAPILRDVDLEVGAARDRRLLRPQRRRQDDAAAGAVAAPCPSCSGADRRSATGASTGLRPGRGRSSAWPTCPRVVTSSSR